MVKDYAKDWKATEKWADKTYLAEQSGNTVVRLKAFTNHPWTMASIKNKKKDIEKDGEKVELDDILNSKKLDGKFSSHYIHSTSSLQPIGTALDRISKNEEESDERISFLDFEVFKAPRLKSDYSYPILHDFLPF